MNITKFNQKWKFWEDKDAFALVWNIPENAREITLPHDAMIEKNAHEKSENKGNTGFRDGGNYTYVKNLFVPENGKNKTYILKFEGSYMNTLVYVNEQLAVKNMFGYTTFYADLTDFLRYGQQNEIRVLVKNKNMTNSRWYSGSGIYRDVYLLEAGATYIVPEGVKIQTENADNDYAVLGISTEIKNRNLGYENIKLRTIIKNQNGEIVGKEDTICTIFENEQKELYQRIVIENPDLWSDETPILYTCETILYKNTIELDKNIETFGIRTLSLDAKRGFRVNGKTVKLRGACIHHDSGLLGAATYEDAQYRQVEMLKSAGFNAIRMSHHPMASAMLRACDKLGVYVMDEAFDMWTRCKSDLDYALYFDEWWQKDATAMVRKDYNHPSVILYSVGNEIPEIGTDHGAKICHDICAKIKELDNTRYTLASINGVFAAGDRVGEIIKDISANLVAKGKIDGNVNDFMTLMDGHMDEIVLHKAISERLEKACAATDIAGYNYMTARYEPDGKNYPSRVIVGSETYPPEIARNWSLVKKLNHVIGDFTWTGWDYIGEAGVGIPAYNFGEGGFGAAFPCQLAYCGDIDITGFRRPASYYREIVFGLTQKPYIAVQKPEHYGKYLIKTPWVMSDTISSWTFDGFENKPIIVEVYSAGDEVELIINNKSIGKKTAGQSVEYRTLFETTYNAGSIVAISYENGKEIGRTELKTANNDYKVVMDTHTYNELVYIDLWLKDRNGIVVTDKDCKIQVNISGDAILAGFGSGNPKTNYNYNQNITETFNGHALLILKKTDMTDNFNVQVCIIN